MAKNFAPRVSKRERKTIDVADRLERDIFRLSDEKLMQGARIDKLKLKEITVKDQVRTKFNDNSIKELAANIRENGLIQPLVVHKKGDTYTLICGERRYRAMTTIEMMDAPCFILENKSEQELMAIQFSENSAREALHYIDKADGILNYQKATGASERKIQAALGISKSDVHRALILAKMPNDLKEAAKQHDIEKYVLLELDALPNSEIKKELRTKLLKGEVTKRAQLQKAIKASGLVSAGKKAPMKNLSATAFLKAMEEKTKGLALDPKTESLLRSLVEETKEMVDL